MSLCSVIGRTVGRLTSEEWLSDSDVGIYSFVYEFDAAGNRSLLTKDGVTTYYCYNTLNQLTLTETTAGALTYYTYQADGALETKHDADGWAYYEWDVDEALLRVMRDGTVTGQANELYDADMKRVARDLDGTATYYVFDGEKIARVEQPEAGTRDFYVQEGQSIYSPLVSVHDEAAGAHYWYLFDALGSTMGLVDANGNLSGKVQYDAFGNVLAEENVPRSAFFKYVGAYQYMPEEFEGMMLLWHRWYEPTVGRFVGRDRQPSRLSALLGYLYAYPTSAADPTGYDPPRFWPEIAREPSTIGWPEPPPIVTYPVIPGEPRTPVTILPFDPLRYKKCMGGCLQFMSSEPWWGMTIFVDPGLSLLGLAAAGLQMPALGAALVAIVCVKTLSFVAYCDMRCSQNNTEIVPIDRRDPYEPPSY